MDANEKVIEALQKAGKPLRPGELAEAAGLPKKDVDKVIKTLVKEGKLYSPARCFYDLKK